MRSSILCVVALGWWMGCADQPLSGLGSVAPALGPRDDSLATTAMLDGPATLAFKSGYHDKERIWVRSQNSDPREVSSWPVDPSYEATCGVSWSTAGYWEGSGRFSHLSFDPGSRRLLFAESLRCGEQGQRQARLLSFDVDSGRTRVLLDHLSGPPSVLAAAGVVIVQIAASDAPDVSPDAPAPGVFELSGTELVPIVPASAYDGGELYALSDRVILVLEGLAPLERIGGGWRFSRLLASLGTQTPSLAVSASGTRICSISQGSGWVFDVRDHVGVAQLPADSGWNCAFAPDEQHVAFGAHVFALDGEAQLSAVEQGPAQPQPRFSPSGTWGGELYGTEGNGVFALNWSTLQFRIVLAAADAPALCSSPQGTGLVLPPDDRPLSVLHQSCGCTDCDISGRSTFRLDNGALQTIEAPTGEHEVNDFTWTEDGGALQMSAQSTGGNSNVVPEAGAYFTISSQGAVTLTGPLARVTGVVHDPVVIPAAR